jgi:thiosulfate dehydrogenase
MKHILNKKSVAAACLLVLAAASASVLARDPFPPEELARQESLRLELVDYGYALWHGSLPSMSSNGLACGNCHPDTAATNPQTFPKYIQSIRRVVQFSEMVNWCIENPQVGKALDPTSKEMTALQAYAMNMHSGEPITPGLASEQTKPISVKYGKGFPSKPSGIGFDTK